MKKAFKKIYSFLKFQLVDQKNYVFLSLSSVDFKHSIVKYDENLKIFLANSSHKLKIKNDLIPHFDEQQDYFKQFLDFEREDILCYLCEKDNKIVHYFLVFTDSKNSPLKKTRFKKSLKSFSQSAYLGNTFTIKKERGGWIVLQVLSKIVRDLEELHDIKDILVLIHPETRGALKFYQRLGFKIVN